MDLVPWRPFGGELTPFRREMDDLWKRFFGEIPLAKRLGEEWWPSVDVLETKDNLVVKAELPGLAPKDVDVSISGDHYVERYYGSFQRSFKLPSTVQTDKIEASFDKGVLKVTLPKAEEAKKKRIEVKIK